MPTHSFPALASAPLEDYSLCRYQVLVLHFPARLQVLALGFDLESKLLVLTPVQSWAERKFP